jgi:hypothetical protein
MRTMFLAAATVAALSGSTSAMHTLEAKTTATAAAQTPQSNPTGLPSYLMRPDGLMTNGLLPANAWQG